MSELEHQSEIPNDALAAAQLEKLRLEIDQLKTGRDWEQRTISFLPLLTVLIAVSGFLFGIYQFRNQQQAHHDELMVQQQKDRAANEREQDIRIQNQINGDGQQLFRFVNDKQMTMSTVVFSLQDLDELCEFLSHGDKDKAASVRRKISLALRETVWDECDFNSARDVQFNNNAITLWSDYLEYLKTESGNLPYLIGRYKHALAALYRSSPAFFRTLHYKEDGSWEVPMAISQSQFDLFEDLLSGIKTEIEALDDEKKKTYVKEFETTLCNPTLTQQTFGLSFPATDPDVLKACK